MTCTHRYLDLRVTKPAVRFPSRLEETGRERQETTSDSEVPKAGLRLLEPTVVLGSLINSLVLHRHPPSFLHPHTTTSNVQLPLVGYNLNPGGLEVPSFLQYQPFHYYCDMRIYVGFIIASIFATTFAAPVPGLSRYLPWRSKGPQGTSTSPQGGSTAPQGSSMVPQGGYMGSYPSTVDQRHPSSNSPSSANSNSNSPKEQTQDQVHLDFDKIPKVSIPRDNPEYFEYPIPASYEYNGQKDPSYKEAVKTTKNLVAAGLCDVPVVGSRPVILIKPEATSAKPKPLTTPKIEKDFTKFPRPEIPQYDARYFNYHIPKSYKYKGLQGPFTLRVFLQGSSADPFYKEQVKDTKNLVAAGLCDVPVVGSRPVILFKPEVTPARPTKPEDLKTEPKTAHPELSHEGYPQGINYKTSNEVPAVPQGGNIASQRGRLDSNGISPLSSPVDLEKASPVSPNSPNPQSYASQFGSHNLGFGSTTTPIAVHTVLILWSPSILECSLAKPSSIQYD
ncbi:hypothetical protein F5880DRAFT_1511878 [Lentinula raphanica]|nr:hypothetical protein F5880DRAFT_1511878 [Lentinula raphanica]